MLSAFAESSSSLSATTPSLFQRKSPAANKCRPQSPVWVRMSGHGDREGPDRRSQSARTGRPTLRCGC